MVKNHYQQLYLGQSIDRYEEVSSSNKSAEEGFCDTMTSTLTKTALDNKARLFQAAALGDLPTLTALIKEDKSSIELQDNSGNTVLHFAAYYGQAALISALIEYNAQVGTKNNKGALACHCAAVRGNDEALKILLSKDRISQLEAQDNDGNTPLHLAAYAGHSSTLKTVLCHCPPLLEAKNKMSRTAVHLAAGGGKIETLSLLIDNYSAQMEIADEKGTHFYIWPHILDMSLP